MGGDTEQNLVAVLIILVLPLVRGDVVLLILRETALQVSVGRNCSDVELHPIVKVPNGQLILKLIRLLEVLYVLN